MKKRKSFVIEFWAPVEERFTKELKIGDVARLKTRGASHLIDTLWNRDSNPVTAGTASF